jgi:hypothetical protein
MTEDIKQENMEVHPHPHIHHSKKWKDYLFEFLMLFLAVTAGFFMENLREYRVEKERAKEYAVSLYDDVVKDSSSLNTVIGFSKLSIVKIDTLKQILNAGSVDDSAVTCIYRLSAYAFMNLGFSGKNSTIDQLKNSGSLRYFRNAGLIANFSLYDTKLQALQKNQDVNFYVVQEMRKSLTQFLDLSSITHLTISDSSTALPAVIAKSSAVLKLYNNSAANLRQYANWCALKQADLENRIKAARILLDAARKLTASLKKEFDF